MELFFIMLIRVFLQGFQQQNVIKGFYGWAITTSLFMAVAEASLYIFISDRRWASIPYIAAGGVAGITGAMYVHRRWFSDAG